MISCTDFLPFFRVLKKLSPNQCSRGCLYNVTLPNVNAQKTVSVSGFLSQNHQSKTQKHQKKHLQTRRQQDINSEWLQTNQTNLQPEVGCISEIHLWYTQPMTKSPTSTHQSVPWLLRTSGKFQQLGSHERQIYRVMMWCDIWRIVVVNNNPFYINQIISFCCHSGPSSKYYHHEIVVWRPGEMTTWWYMNTCME